MTKRTRVLLKVSGEALMGERNYGHDFSTLNGIASDIKEVCESGVEVCVVVGGGNIYRGSNSQELNIDRATADHMGMLATVINALALQSAMEKQGIHTRVQSAVSMMNVCEPFVRRKARRHMEKGRVVIFAAGIGSPFFTTDSAAVLRAIEMKCDLLFKGTKVDGVYSADPKENGEAVRYEKISYSEVLKGNLRVMDMAAIAVAKENAMPIKVFSIKKKGNFVKVLQDQGKFTLIE